jgi:hypothetical protein
MIEVEDGEAAAEVRAKGAKDMEEGRRVGPSRNGREDMLSGGDQPMPLDGCKDFSGEGIEEGHSVMTTR